MTTLPNPIILQPPRGSSKLPVFEFPVAEINKPAWQPAYVKPCKGKIEANSKVLGNTDAPSLSIDAWPFFHAAAKTELARSFSRRKSTLHGMLMSGMHGDMLRWDNPSLRIRRQGILSRKDASRSYLSGRFGEACAYLFMKDQGYFYWDHVPTLVDRLAGVKADHPERVRRVRIIKSRLNSLRGQQKALKKRGVLEQPDFVFEKSNLDRALVESKGRMVSPGKTPAFKGDLKKALDQVQVWQSLVTGTKKGFAIGTYLREVGDAYDESLLAFVDPPVDDNGEPIVTLSIEDIRRGNYGAWLRGMGLPQTAMALAYSERRETQAISLPVFSLGKLEFVIHSLFLGPLMSWSEWTDSSQKSFPQLMFNFAPVLGLELRTMQAVEQAVNNPDSGGLSKLETVSYDGDNDFQGSVFPDGSFFGQLSEQLRFDRFEEFKL